MIRKEDKLRLLIRSALNEAINQDSPTIDLHAPTTSHKSHNGDNAHSTSKTSKPTKKKTIVGGHFDSNDVMLNTSKIGKKWNEIKTVLAMKARRTGEISNEEYDDISERDKLHEFGANILREKVPQLSKWKVTKVLGKGAHKIALLLSNDHVLSISSGEETNEPGYAIMKKVEDKLWSGKATSHDLGVFDVGKITSDGHYWYAEMSKVIPLHLYVNTFGGYEDKVDWKHVGDIRRYVIPAIMRIVRKKPDISADRIIKIFKSRGATYKNMPEWLEDVHYAISVASTKIGPELTWGWVKAAAHAAVNYGGETIRDAHFENVGVNIADPSKLIIFDLA